MKRIFKLPILAVLITVLFIAGPSFAQSPHSDVPSVRSDVPADLERLRALAEKGDPNAQFQLGELYEAGETVARDLAKAVEAYRRAAEQGHPGAQYALAHIYHLGSGIEQDMAAAMIWYRKAARQGNEWAQLALGDQYRIGLVVPRDLAQSTEWYRRAADQGNIFAQFELGNAYRYGNGVEPDIAQAIKWYRLSAEAGNPSAQLALTELAGGTAVAAGETAPTTDPSHGARSDGPGADPAADPAFSAKAMATAPEDDRVPPRSDLGGAAQAASAAPPGGGGDPGTESADAASSPVSDEAAVARLLSLAEAQAARLALTTPAGDNAYETYQEILSIEPNNESALDGIEQLGVKYVELAALAAGKGNLQKANLYARKAAVLAPEHSLAQSMTIPREVDQPTRETTVFTSKSLDDLKSQQRNPAPEEEPTGVEAARTTPASVRPEHVIEDADDLVFNPADYQGRQVAVAGGVAHLFWGYRLIAKSGQNSIVIDIDGLSQAERDRLEAAINKAGFLGQVHARITGTVERQGLATFELAATHLALGELGASERKSLELSSPPELTRDNSLVVPVYPGEPFGQPYPYSNLTRSGDHGQASGSGAGSRGGASGGGGSEGASGGGSGSSGGSGNGNSGNGNSGNNNSGNNNSGNNNSGNGNSGNGNSGNGNSGNGNSGNRNSGQG